MTNKKTKQTPTQNTGRTLASIVSFAGGFGFGVIMRAGGRDVVDMANDLKTYKGIGYVLPGLYGAMSARHIKNPIFQDFAINIAAAEVGYILGCSVGIN